MEGGSAPSQGCYLHKTKRTQKKSGQTCMSRVGFEATIPGFETVQDVSLGRTETPSSSSKQRRCHVDCNGRTTHCLEASALDLIEELSKNSPVVTEDTHRKPYSGYPVSQTRFEQSTSRIMSREMYRLVKLLELTHLYPKCFGFSVYILQVYTSAIAGTQERSRDWLSPALLRLPSCEVT